MSVMLAVRFAKGVNCCEPAVHGSAYLFIEGHVSIKCFSSSGSIAFLQYGQITGEIWLLYIGCEAVIGPCTLVGPLLRAV